MIRRATSGAALFLVALMMPSVASAQETHLSELLVKLIQADIRLAPPPVGTNHEAHFVPGEDQRIAPFFFNQQIVTQLATFPLGSSSGGFAYTFNPVAGTFERATESFGPAFAERALTNGKGRLTAGVNFQYSKYTSFEGFDLDNGEVKFFVRHAVQTGAFFEGDLIEAALKLNLSSSTTTIFANYGINDRWDLAVALPLIRVSMDAVVDATVIRQASGSDSVIHVFPNGTTTQQFTAAGSASGIGDVLLRTKYRLTPTASGLNLAGGLDVRLPTGDADNLLGTGAPQITVMGIASTTRGSFHPHVNLSFAASGSGGVVTIPKELGYRVGTEYVVRPTVTLSADLIGRTLINAGRLKVGETRLQFTDVNGASQSTTLREFDQSTGLLNLASVALGGKFNVAGNLLISANVIAAITSSGVTARLTPVIGVDYSF